MMEAEALIADEAATNGPDDGAVSSPPDGYLLGSRIAFSSIAVCILAELRFLIVGLLSDKGLGVNCVRVLAQSPGRHRTWGVD